MVVQRIVAPELESCLSRVPEPIRLARGRRLALRDSEEIRVERGVAALFVERRRRCPLFLALAGPGSVCPPIADGATYLLALTDTDLLSLGDAQSSIDVVGIPGPLAAQVIMRLVDVLEVSAGLRVLRRLTELNEALGIDGALTVRQQDLAAMAQTSRATANAVLRQEERKGTLSLGRGLIAIHDIDRIKRRAGIDCPSNSRSLPL